MKVLGWRQDTMLGWFAGGGSMFDRQGGFGRAGGATLREMAASAMDVRTGKMTLNDYSSSYGSRMSMNEGMQALASYNEAVYQTLSLRATYTASSGKFYNPMVALWRVAAEYLRNSAVMLASSPSGLPTFVFNPLYKAEAVYWDAGWSFVGQEGDTGGFLILAGEQAGEIHEFTEESMAALSIDAGVGVELGRVDILDRPEKTFTSNHFYGYREKVWGSYSFPIAPSAPLINGSVNLASSVSYYDGAMVVATSIGLGVGIGPTSWSAGWNNGFIKKRD